MDLHKLAGHIVAMGGGGFSMEPGNPLLDDFVLSLAPRHPGAGAYRVALVNGSVRETPLAVRHLGSPAS